MNATDFGVIQILLKQNGFTVGAAQYHSESFGSWYVEVEATPPLRVVWDGKDGWLIVQDKTSQVFNGSYVWRDLWIGKMRSEQTPERAVEVLLAHAAAA